MSTFTVGGPARFDHQRRGLNKMITTGGVTALLFDPGMGKTAVVLDYAGLLALKSPTGEARILVVCPLAAVDTWVLQADLFMSPMVNYWAEALGGSLLRRAEALASRGGQPYTKPLGPNRRPRRVPPRRLAALRALHHEKAVAWGCRADAPPQPLGERPPITASEGPDAVPTPRVVLEIVNIDTLTSRAQVGGSTMADVMLAAVERFKPDLLVVDESHKIKSATGNASRLLYRIGKTVRRRIILTGTVMPHSPLDVFGQWRFLEPYAFGDTLRDGTRRQMTLGGFKARYVIQGGWMGREITGFRNLDDMQQTMAKNAVVARKDQALDLPPTTDVVVPVTLSPTEAKAYREMKTALVTQLASGAWSSTSNRLAQMMRLRQITSGHLPDDSTGTIERIGTSKTDVIASLVHDTLTGEKRIVIFAFFTAEIDDLTVALTQPGTEVMTITGGTSIADRELMRHRFGSDDPVRLVMVAQVKTMSLAVNELVTANHAIFASLSQQRDDLIQARDRLDRIGQTRPVTFWYALAPGTVDEVILTSHTDRTNLENAMLKHIQDQP